MDLAELEPPSSRFSADRSILGFKYQIRYALFLMFEAQRSNGLDVSIDVERIDDIDVRSQNRITKLVQTKDTATVLTNSSAPFWKTIRIWSDSISNELIDLATIQSFQLIATSDTPAADSAIVNQLSSDVSEQRQRALVEMRQLAEANRHQQTLGRAYDAFHNLEDIQQEQLVNKITIRLNAPTFDELDKMIEDQVVHGPPDKRNAFSQVLFGRWDSLIEGYLRRRTKTSIAWQQLQALLHEISLEFDDDNLPTVFANMIQDAIPSLSDDHRTFIKQLQAIGATDDQRKRAQRSFLRSTQLLSFWERKVLVRPDEIATYNERLIDECGLQHEAAVAQPVQPPLSPEQVGQFIYNWAILTAAHQEAMRLRRRCSDPDIVRGCFHALANHPYLGWHPSWESLFPAPVSGS